MQDITEIGWAELNKKLLATTDEKLLSRWLEATLASGSLYRALRVHGRLSAVRRQREIRDIKLRMVKKVSSVA